MSGPNAIKKINHFLQSARTKVESGSAVVCVVGNEAADLDSIASAVMYAYFREVTEESRENAVYVPLINIPRADFKLRTEAVYLVKESGITPEELLFTEDLDITGLHRDGRLTLILVDHNRPTGSLVDCRNLVKGIIDHHADEGLYTDVPVRTIEPVGSAATLVAREILRVAPESLDEGGTTLLLGTILLDTVNLDSAAGRVTPEDQEIARTLLDRSDTDQQKLFDALQREKFNVSALDSADLLRKDYKSWTMSGLRVGISSVLLSVEDWLKKDSRLSNALDRYLRSEKLDLLLAMNAYTNPEFTRELVVYAPDSALRKRVIAFLENSDLGVQRISSKKVDEATVLYAQANVAISRKKLQPLLAAFLESGTA